MNTNIHIVDIPEKWNNKVKQLFTRAECTLSRFKKESELSQLNRTRSIPFVSSPILFEAVKVANHYYHVSAGIYNPYMGKQISTLGYNCSFDNMDHPTIPYNQVTSAPFQDHVAINTGMKSISIINDVQIDLAGIAKGWTAQCIADLLKQEYRVSSGAIVAGGDIYAWGTELKRREIIIDHPDYSNKALCSFHLSKDAGVATSSIRKRSWISSEGEALHHILHPKTGYPAYSDLVQVTIIAPTLTEAEILTKCLLVLGWEEGNQLGNRMSIPYMAISLTKNGNLIMTKDNYFFTRKGVKIYESSY
ncbi:FAD:protein FMN transferase [Bacillus sp. B1-b2]|uniref:FAD:protein FMN transferase n=1 Tax=Bacillus sp. B1-b2 TaxID=2653201 RepID=UPI00186AABAA|nr:FAD:protein FMN transferase [Bacillus sp. B1-b2]